MTRTNRPWTHTSDDSYMYQLSLVVAIAITILLVVIILGGPLYGRYTNVSGKDGP